jgi:ubiquinone/menaquinone biosynthesis C-methylase UbiE
VVKTSRLVKSAMGDRVDYDRIAADYEGRYKRNDYTGATRALAAFLQGPPGRVRQRVLEVGCGTGHWVRLVRETHVDVVGLDPSGGMLAIARARLPEGRLIRARAEALPCREGTFDRVFCINALHHFSAPAAFFSEARRVLDPAGGLLTVGLDPHTGQDRWWVYDYFPSALHEDRRRYLPAGRIRELMNASGFSRCETVEIQHMPVEMTVSEAAGRGFLSRSSASQLTVISQAEYDVGLKRIQAADRDGSAAILRSDLRLYGTTGWVA